MAAGGWCVGETLKDEEKERADRERDEQKERKDKELKIENDQKNKQYRFIQSPFANEVHAWLNLSYERFESGDGEKFYKLINTVLREIRLSLIKSL